VIGNSSVLFDFYLPGAYAGLSHRSLDCPTPREPDGSRLTWAPTYLHSCPGLALAGAFLRNPCADVVALRRTKYDSQHLKAPTDDKCSTFLNCKSSTWHQLYFLSVVIVQDFTPVVSPCLVAVKAEIRSMHLFRQTLPTASPRQTQRRSFAVHCRQDQQYAAGLLAPRQSSSPLR
jgi:hypothetical protein